MNAKWLIAKYVPDLRRREPRNVGVILFTDHGAIHRFHGEILTGADGRKTRTKKIRSVDNYEAWMAYWKRSASKGDPRELLSPADPQKNYFVEFGGERLLGNKDLDPDAFLDYLYRELVEEKTSEEKTSEETAAKAATPERIFERLKIEVQKPGRLTLDVGGGVHDRVAFDYAYQNGVYTLMKNVQVVKDPWDPVHLALYSIEKTRAKHKNYRFVSLLSVTSAVDSTEPIEILRKESDIVDMSDEDTAVRELGTALKM
jgi:hypothetical protein